MHLIYKLFFYWQSKYGRALFLGRPVVYAYEVSFCGTLTIGGVGEPSTMFFQEIMVIFQEPIRISRNLGKIIAKTYLIQMPVSRQLI